MVTGITLLIVAFIAIIFFYIAWHTYHGDLIPLFLGAVIFLIALALGFISLDIFNVFDF